MSSYFDYKKEVACKCCGLLIVDEGFIRRMNTLRHLHGQPIYINSWVRCLAADEAVGGKGNHTEGKAADLRCTNSKDRYSLIKYAYLLRFQRIGVANSFIHLDDMEGRPEEVLWLYGTA